MQIEKVTGVLRELLSPRAGKTDVHLGEAGFLRKILRRPSLESVFLFVTSRCNSRCRTCFAHETLNQGTDLSFEQLRKVAESVPHFDKLWLSGGEPCLREDLAEVIELFYHQNGIRSINFPTNGSLPDRAEKIVARLLDSCPKLTIHLNFSVDGLGATHDRIRGIDGSFRTVLDTMDRIGARFGGHPRLVRNIATVVTRETREQMLSVGAYLMERNCAGTHFFENVRGNPRDPSLKGLTRAELEQLHLELFPLYDRMADRLFENVDPRARWFAKLFFLGTLRLMYTVQEENVEGPTPWGMDCTAGLTTAVIDHDGSIRACELRPPIGRLEDYGYDLRAALTSEAMRREIQAIGGGHRANCWCTHGCWVISSLQFSPKTLLFRIPWGAIQWRRQGSKLSLPQIDPALLGEIGRAPAPRPRSPRAGAEEQVQA